MRRKHTSLLRALRLQAMLTAVLPVLLAAHSPALWAQSIPILQSGLEMGQTAPFEATIGYSFLQANAPAGLCGCFSMNQGAASFVYNAQHGIGYVADVSGGRANSISGSLQTISLITYLGGARYSWKLGSSRYTLYGQALLGGSTELSNYVFSQNVKGFALMPGGGVKIWLRPHFAWNVEADWLHSDIANNANNRQNDLRMTTGIIFRFAGR